MTAPPRDQLEALGLSASCAEVVRHLWDYLDDQSSPASAARLRAHIEGCTQCQGYSAYQSGFLEAVARLRAELGAPDGLRAKLAAELREQGCGCWARVQGDVRP